jgi:N-acetylglucosamine-6-phosphate deacetylase
MSVYGAKATKRGRWQGWYRLPGDVTQYNGGAYPTREDALAGSQSRMMERMRELDEQRLLFSWLTRPTIE